LERSCSVGHVSDGKDRLRAMAGKMLLVIDAYGETNRKLQEAAPPLG